MFFFAEFILAQSRRITSARSLGLNPKKNSVNSANTGEFDCPEEFGYYPHPSDCSQYYVCVFGGALLESCTGGLMYSHELQTCDWPRNVGCELSAGPAPAEGSRSQQVVHQSPQTHKFRFSSLQAGTTYQSHPQQLKQQQPHQQQPAPFSQQQSLPPPPELRIAPNPVVTSRGHPKQQQEQQQNIAKVGNI